MKNKYHDWKKISIEKKIILILGISIDLCLLMTIDMFASIPLILIFLAANLLLGWYCLHS